MDHNRRKFLKSAGVLASSMLLPLQFAATNTRAAVTGNKKLVVLTLNGGNDGLNTIVPLSRVDQDDQYNLYAGYRPTIKIPKEQLLPLDFANNTTGVTFGAHPSLAKLVTPENISNLAIFPATHSSLDAYLANTSHFYQMDLFARGLSDPQTTTGAIEKGWIGRYLDSRYTGQVAESDIIAQDFTGGTQGNIRSSLYTLDFANPANLDLGTPDADAIRESTKYISTADHASYAGRHNDIQRVLFDEVLNELSSVDIFTRPLNAAYPVDGSNVNLKLGTKFRQIADMFAGLPELEVVHIAQGGYDTHQKQVEDIDTTTGTQANLLKNWAESIAAFFDDLSAVDAETGSTLASDVIVVVQTEFGRTVDENDNSGTDHGHASCWMAFGGSVQGGIYGGYDGLESQDLNTGADRLWLRPKVDYRDIYARIISDHLGYSNLDIVFPDYNFAANTLNFLAQR